MVFIGRILAQGLAWIVGNEITKFTAKKILLYSAITLVLPFALYKTYGLITRELLEIANAKMNEFAINPTAHQITGMAGYVLGRLKVPECVQVMMTAVSSKLMLKLIMRF